MEIVSYLIKSMSIEKVIKELEESFCGLDIVIKNEGHDFYLIQFNTFNGKRVDLSEHDLIAFDIFFKYITDAIMSYEKVENV